jgi:hypothetical protein
MVTLEPPELVRVAGTDWVLPVCTEPKVKLDGLTVNAPGMTAVPVRGTATLALDAVERMVRLPLSVPADLGEQVIVTLELWLGARVIGVLIAFAVNPVPVTVAWFTVTLAPPEFVMVADNCWLSPTNTEPNAKELGVVVRTPGEATVADRATFNVGLEALLAITTLPLPAPADCGANVTVKVAAWPEAIVRGGFGPLKVYPAPVAEAWLMVTLALPELVTSSDLLWLLPT